MKESQMTNEDEKVAVENETPEATQETEAPVETPAEEPIMAGEGKMSAKKDMKKEAMHGKDKKKMDESEIVQKFNFWSRGMEDMFWHRSPLPLDYI